MSQPMTEIQKGNDAKAQDKAAERDRLKAAVPIHPALVERSKAEAEAKAKASEAGKVLAEESKKAKPAAAAAPAAKPEQKPEAKPEPTEQEKNYAALRSEVQKAKDRADALEKENAALKAQKPAEIPAKPPADPWQEAQAKVLARVRPEDKGYWESVVLPSVRDMVAPALQKAEAVAQENAELKGILQEAAEGAKRRDAKVAAFSSWADQNELTSEGRDLVIEAVQQNGLAPLMDHNPEVALNAARGILLGQGKWKTGGLTPEQKAEAEKAAKDAEEAEDRARAKAGGVDASATVVAPETDGRIDWNKLIAEAQAKNDWSEVRRLRNRATLAAAGVKADWLSGERPILAP